MSEQTRSLALVTGAASGIGFQLARVCATNGFDLVVAADGPSIHDAARKLQQPGLMVVPVQADLASPAGVDAVVGAIAGRAVDALLTNDGIGLAGAFLDQDFGQIRQLIDRNVIGTLDLIQRIGRQMRDRGAGRILITGAIAGLLPGTFEAVYIGTKALLDLFAFALRAELRDAGVTVTCLMPGGSENELIERAYMTDKEVRTDKEELADQVAALGFHAMMTGEGEVVTGWDSKLKGAITHFVGD